MGAEIIRLPAWRHWRRQTKRSNGRQTGLGHMLFTENIQYANYGLQKSHTTAHPAEQVATITNENGCASLKH